MANVRLTHPAINLERSALDLAHYYLHADPQHISELVEKVRYQFGKSWMSRLMWSNKTKEVVPASMIRGIDTLFPDNDWGEDAVNTNIMRELMKRLDGYDPVSVSQLTYDEIILLTPVFITSLERLTEIAANEEKLKIQNDIILKQVQLEKQKQEMERYKNKLERLSAKMDKTNELADLEMKRMSLELQLSMVTDQVSLIQADKIEKEKALQKLEADFPQRKINFEMVLKTLIALNPARLSGTEIEQAAKLAQDAMLTFIAETKKQRDKRADMEMVKVSRQQEQAVEMQRRAAEEKRDKEASQVVAQTRLQEAQQLCQQVKTQDRDSIKKELAKILVKKPTVLEKKEKPVIPVTENTEAVQQPAAPEKARPGRNKKFQEAYEALSLFHHLRAPAAVAVKKEEKKATFS